MRQSATGAVQDSRLSALESAIAGQPDSVSDVITTNFDGIRAAATLVAAARRVRLCGVGIGAQAAVVGEYLLRSVGVDARAANAFDLASYPSSLDPGEMVIVVGQRDERAFPSRVLQRAAHAGLKTVAITTPGFSAPGADVIIEASSLSEDEPAAIAMPAAMAVLAAIAARFEPRAPLAAAVPALREIVRAALSTRDQAREVAEALLAAERQALVVGAGAGSAVAHAGALAVREAAGVSAWALHLEDALHGALVPLSDGDVLVQVAPEGAADDRQADIAAVANALGLDRWKIGGKPDGSRWHSPLPAVPEIVAAIPATLPLQWLALECALARGADGLRRDDPRFTVALREVAL